MATTFSRRGQHVEGQCSETVYEGSWPGNCTRAAVADGLCRPHLTGKRRRDANRQREEAKYRAERAEQAFVQRWRAEHPDEVWGKTWTCSLCNQSVQVLPDGDSEGAQERAMKRHQRDHGPDWIAYTQAAQGGGEADR